MRVHGAPVGGLPLPGSNPTPSPLDRQEEQGSTIPTFIDHFRAWTFGAFRIASISGGDITDLTSALRQKIEEWNRLEFGMSDRLSGSLAAELYWVVDCALSYLRRRYRDSGISPGRLVITLWPAEELLLRLVPRAERRD